MKNENFTPSIDVVTEKERLELNSKISSDNLAVAKTNLETAKTVLEQIKTNKTIQDDAIKANKFRKDGFDKIKILLYLSIGLECIQFVMHIIETYF